MAQEADDTPNAGPPCSSAFRSSSVPRELFIVRVCRLLRCDRDEGEFRCARSGADRRDTGRFMKVTMFLSRVLLVGSNQIVVCFRGNQRLTSRVWPVLLQSCGRCFRFAADYCMPAWSFAPR